MKQLDLTRYAPPGTNIQKELKRLAIGLAGYGHFHFDVNVASLCCAEAESYGNIGCRIRGNGWYIDCCDFCATYSHGYRAAAAF